MVKRRLALGIYLLCTTNCLHQPTAIGPFSVEFRPRLTSDLPIFYWKIEENKPARFTVFVNSCATPCIENLETRCTVRREGKVLYVAADATYDALGMMLCADVCSRLSVECDASAIPAGTSRIEFSTMREREPRMTPEVLFYRE